MTILIPLLETYLSHYKKDPDQFIDMIGKLDVPKQVGNALYQLFVYRKELAPIEAINQEDKNRIWNRAKGYTTNHNHRIMISRSIYLIESIIND